MPGRTRAAAARAFLAPLQRVVSCVTETPLILSPGSGESGQHALTFAGEPTVRLKTAGEAIHLRLAMRWETVEASEQLGPWRVHTVAYAHTVFGADPSREMLAFHWHPVGVNPHVPAHVHIGDASLTPGSLITHKLHVPTGRVSIEEVVRLCIGEFGVRPLRDDWEQVLRDSEDLFKMFRSWHA